MLEMVAEQPPSQKMWASLAAAVTGTPVGGQLWDGRTASSRGEDGKIAEPCSSRCVVDMWESPTLLSSLPLSQGRWRVWVSGEERDRGRCLLPAVRSGGTRAQGELSGLPWKGVSTSALVDVSLRVVTNRCPRVSCLCPQRHAGDWTALGLGH